MDESTQQQLREYPPPWSARTVPGVHGMTMLDIVDAGGKTVQTTVDHPAVRPRVALIVEAVNAYAAQQEQAAQVKALVEALRPLAALADAYPDSYSECAVGWEFVTASGKCVRVTLGDARKAAAALKAVEGEEPAP